MPENGFPSDDHLCERCGYALRGLSSDQSCPECGNGVGESDPALRTGLAWQNRISPIAWLATCWAIVARPTRSYRRLRIGDDRGRRRDRCFLAIWALLIGLTWGLSRLDRGWEMAIDWGLGAAFGVVFLTYIEAFGVAYFSRKRGWRVPWPLAERVACYAAIGWVPAAIILWKLNDLILDGSIKHWWPQQLGPWTLRTEVLVLTLAGGIGILWFETLVWLGVRQVRYANQPA